MSGNSLSALDAVENPKYILPYNYFFNLLILWCSSTLIINYLKNYCIFRLAIPRCYLFFCLTVCILPCNISPHELSAHKYSHSCTSGKENKTNQVGFESHYLGVDCSGWDLGLQGCTWEQKRMTSRFSGVPELVPRSTIEQVVESNKTHTHIHTVHTPVYCLCSFLILDHWKAQEFVHFVG